jgi:hypothetical protein
MSLFQDALTMREFWVNHYYGGLARVNEREGDRELRFINEWIGRVCTA